MGKAQSKRSIDITTDPKKVGEGDEVAGKVEKIEDVDQQKVGDVAAAPPLNGEAATPKEGGEAASEKKDSEDHSENDKDLTTEKSASEVKGSGEGDASGDAAAETSKDAAAVAESPKDSGGAEEISPLADESIKSKSKKDKVKKKWSFRSISFGKKDKQKPAKTEEPVSPTAAPTATPETSPAAVAEGSAAPAEPTTNGEAPEQPKEEAAAAEPANLKDDVKPVENGSATAQEQQAANGGDEKRPLTPPIVEEPAKPEETAAAAISTAETIVVQASTETAAKEPLTATEVVTNGHDSTEEGLTNGNKNGLAESPVAESAAVNIPSKVDDEEPHQNGTNGISSGSATPPPTPVAAVAPAAESEAEQIKNKSQIEVNQTDITPSNSSNNNAHNNTVNTSTKTLTTETETTENSTTITTTTTTETETTIAAADLVQTQTTNTVPTIPTPPPTYTTDTTTTTTDNTNTNIPDTLQSVEETEEGTPGGSSAEEEQVVQAIIAAVSSEAEPDAEGFVVVSSAPLELESDSKSAFPDPAEPVVPTEVSNPPPLPKSPPPSRVSAFALAEEEDNDTTAATVAVPESYDSEKLAVAIEDKANADIEKNEELSSSIEIEQQAQIIVDEITEQAAEILKCEEKKKADQEEEEEKESKQVTAEDVRSNEILHDLPAPAALGVVAQADYTSPADADADDSNDDKSRLPENELEHHVPEEAAADTQTDNNHRDQIEISIDHITTKLEALPQLNGDNNVLDDGDDAKANDDDLNELDRNIKDITKDLKEKNAAAAEVTTQELPVTCE